MPYLGRGPTTHRLTSPGSRGLVAGLAAAALLASACGSASGAGGSGSDEQSPGQRVQVIASFYPMAWVARKVGGGAVTVKDLTPPGVEPHDLELAPRDIIEVGEADLVVYVNGLSPSLDQAVAQHAKDSSLDAISVADSVPSSDEHEHEEESGHEEEHAEHGVDPHFWLDPTRLATVAKSVGDRLSDIDPEHAKGYRQRAHETAGELRNLDERYRSELRNCASRTVVTSHEAFGYLAARYNLDQVAIAGLDPSAEPSPHRLAGIAETMKAENVRVVFFETLVSPKLADVVAHETGAETEVLDPIESKPRSGDYLSGMRRNLANLERALACR